MFIHEIGVSSQDASLEVILQVQRWQEQRRRKRRWQTRERIRCPCVPIAPACLLNIHQANPIRGFNSTHTNRRSTQFVDIAAFRVDHANDSKLLRALISGPRCHHFEHPQSLLPRCEYSIFLPGAHGIRQCARITIRHNSRACICEQTKKDNSRKHT